MTRDEFDSILHRITNSIDINRVRFSCMLEGNKNKCDVVMTMGSDDVDSVCISDGDIRPTSSVRFYMCGLVAHDVIIDNPSWVIQVERIQLVPHSSCDISVRIMDGRINDVGVSTICEVVGKIYGSIFYNGAIYHSTDPKIHPISINDEEFRIIRLATTE